MGLMISLMLVSCKKKQSADSGNSEKEIMDKVELLSTKYAESIAENSQVDSVKVDEVVEYDKLNYCRMMMDFLSLELSEKESDFQEARSIHDVDAMCALQENINQIVQSQQFYSSQLQEFIKNPSEKIVLYEVTAHYYCEEDYPLPFRFFMTPDYRLYELNPLDYDFLNR